MNALAIHLYLTIRDINLSFNYFGNFYRIIVNDNSPEIPWRNIKGIRDHIAHGYFDIDAEIIYDVTLNEIPRLRETFVRLYSLLS